MIINCKVTPGVFSSPQSPVCDRAEGLIHSIQQRETNIIHTAANTRETQHELHYPAVSEARVRQFLSIRFNPTNQVGMNNNIREGPTNCFCESSLTNHRILFY